jgi:hypothetical protein
MVLMIAALWKVFSKSRATPAGRRSSRSTISTSGAKSWAGLGWWVILMFLPFVNIIIGIILCIDLAKSFGKGAGVGIGIALLGIIFLPILGFGSAQYQGPAASSGAVFSPPPQPA